MDMNRLREALDRRGLSCIEAANKGVPYHNLYKQYKGIRGVGPGAAILYELVLNIPRSELRPDLWPPTEAAPATPPGKEVAGNG